ncbi:MAG: hypothetical protein R3C02_17715 [Planctomycetaceae bacterium]
MPLDAESELIEKTENYQRYRVTFASAPGERVIAWLLMPNDLTDRASAMLCLHQTVPIGKDEPAGLGGKPNLHYAHELANRGYVCSRAGLSVVRRGRVRLRGRSRPLAEWFHEGHLEQHPQH